MSKKNKVQMAMSTQITREGMVRDEKTGDWYLPATQRPDGSWRKPRKVKEGYIPQEEVPVYENKGVQWLKSQPRGPIGLAPAERKPAQIEYVPVSSLSQQQNTTDSVSSVPLSKSAKKNQKRKEKKKQQVHEGGDMCESFSQLSVTGGTLVDPGRNLASTEHPTQVELEKKLRNLKKKLRQIDDLKNKIDSGDIKNPESGQLEKISKRQTVVEEIEDLEIQIGSF